MAHLEVLEAGLVLLDDDPQVELAVHVPRLRRRRDLLLLGRGLRVGRLRAVGPAGHRAC